MLQPVRTMETGRTRMAESRRRITMPGIQGEGWAQFAPPEKSSKEHTKEREELELRIE